MLIIIDNFIRHYFGNSHVTPLFGYRGQSLFYDFANPT